MGEREFIIRLFKEKNEMMLEADLEDIFAMCFDKYDIDVQYQHITEKSSNNTNTFYTALVIARRK